MEEVILPHDLEIRPRPDQFDEVLRIVAAELQRGDQLVLRDKASRPWFRVITQQGESIESKMRRRGVEVRRRGVPIDVPLH